MDIIGPVFWLLVALGLLVTFHEFGHFWVARRCGVRVLCFSVGFGRALWSRTARDGTRYQIAAIPLGGYVQMLDERAQPVPTEQQSESFNRKPVSQRIAIVAAGPIFNLIFAVAAFWLMFVIGIAAMRPIVGEPTGIAADAGIAPQDQIIQVNDQAVETWTHAVLALTPIALDRGTARLVVESPQQSQRLIELDLSTLGRDFKEDETLEALGLHPWRPALPPTIGAVSPGSAADQAGLEAGDRVIAINGVTIDDWPTITQTVPQQGLNDSGQLQRLNVVVERNGREIEFDIMPNLDESGNRPLLGIQSVEPSASMQSDIQRAFVIDQRGPIEALVEATSETWRLSTATLGMLGRMVVGKASLENLSGPITIARLADQSARLGISRFLFFLGLISLSLAIINLLPIPMLDGGHLLYYLVEIIKGSPVSEHTQVVGQYVGLMLIVMLMGVAIFNDILRLIA
mgnify:CR=1 FL=1